ncbi:RNA polymerase, sigma-24 subunit, ECF subfamily [Alkaliphilus metalliredigens QYMF]|uniref:RNA polymerase, sigma-24 subunit, ECF subfamily n=1 Tax=Alkaliphilus metalliredigens (strain QYMF) TaxID=293826 RepID=A6TPA7_ALKMQ|nr:ECF subfamily RNA polymerase sigma-24 factor [Alkaliphilus metalliredigens]ABR48025.1 RNA polymerase, sigma-24 subunit, ECF subfamily [Alkaliphilus metalliredigens QYMF]
MQGANRELLPQINHLNSHYKEVIVLYYYVELSYEEMSEVKYTVIGVGKEEIKKLIFSIE